MHVREGESLYRLADLSVVWVDASVPEADTSLVTIGARADVSVTAWPGRPASGRVTQVYPYVAEQTRTVTVRVRLQNEDGRLKPGMQTAVELPAAYREGLLVPADAVIDSGRKAFVFIAEGHGRFTPRPVVVGARGDDRVLVVSGLREHETVVRRATFLVDSESRLQAALENYGSTREALESPLPGTKQFVLSFSAPSPVRAGDNVFEVRVLDEHGAGITDAAVSLVLSMPAMPSMNMPAMRADARLAHVTGGLYRGVGTLPMPGRWDVSITASRSGRQIATSHTPLMAQ
jgi:hypothetical protein